MKKKRFVGLISVALATVMLCSAFLSGCGLFGGDNNNDDNNNTTPTEYTIQYTDDLGSHTLTVADGATYALEAVPERLGYDFLGLFDAKIGGTQYVDETGQSLSPFTDKKNMVLFPQFTAKEYTIILDYQGATITGERSVTVKYDEKLPELPKNLSKEHSVFAGWYTDENCGGTQVADAYGLIPDKSTLNESLFDIEDAGEYLYLYAGFDVETFTVTFNFGNGIPSEEVEVTYNTPISEVVPETRNSEGKAVLSWSKTSSGNQIFTGNITDDTVLYAVEWAPVIELDSNGGESVTPVVAREGASITLPTPTRQNYRFMGWQNADGEIAEIATMPADGARLTASWQAILVFDENGGTEVQDISQAAGTAVILPTPEKEGFIFAGWYTADEEKYTISSMPVASVELKAGWYETKEDVIVVLPSNKTHQLTITMVSGTTMGPESSFGGGSILVDLSDYIPNTGANISIQLNYDVKIGTSSDVFDAGFFLYDDMTVSDVHYVGRTINQVYTTSYTTFTYEDNLALKTNKLYLFYYISRTAGTVYTSVTFSNINMILTYPDTSNLYL